jgi:hypothetical protein
LRRTGAREQHRGATKNGCCGSGIHVVSLTQHTDFCSFRNSDSGVVSN